GQQANGLGNGKYRNAAASRQRRRVRWSDTLPSNAQRLAILPSRRTIAVDIQNQECPDPVFILGAPRSGTTALAWSLAQHSSLWTSGESYILWELFGHQRGRTGLETIFQTAEVLATGSWLTAE